MGVVTMATHSLVLGVASNGLTSRFVEVGVVRILVMGTVGVVEVLFLFRDDFDAGVVGVVAPPFFLGHVLIRLMNSSSLISLVFKSRAYSNSYLATTNHTSIPSLICSLLLLLQ